VCLDREFLEEVGRLLGTKARLLMTELVNAAAYEEGERSLPDGSVITLHRGDAFATGEHLAKRIVSSPATISRLLFDLHEHGFIRKRPKAWLKDGLGRAPMVVSICEYDRITALPDRRQAVPERSVDEKEEKQLLRRNGIRTRGIRHEAIPAARRQEAVEVLAFYRREVCEECADVEDTLALVAKLVSRFGAEQVKRAARIQAEAGQRWKADFFFGTMDARGLPSGKL